MATKTTAKTLTSDAVKILNGIRNQASANYKDYIPAAKNNDDIKNIGAIMMNFQPLQNEFLNALINRIGLVIVTSKTYENPLSMFKRGLLDYGETVEEVFTNLAEGYQFDPADAETTLYKRYIPDVRASFHVMNFQKFYPVTVSEQQLRQAFLTPSGVYDLISKITETLYTAMNYDEFLVMKYTTARRILDGRTYVKQIDATDAKQAMKTIRETSNALTFMSNAYNPTGVYNHTDKEDQYILINGKFEAALDVDALAYAFNMSKIDIEAHKVLIDGFGSLDRERLNKLLGSNPSYTPLTAEECEALDEIPALLVDSDFFIVYDNLIEFKEKENAKGLYWNYFLHSWKTFSTSPYSNAVTFCPTEPTVTGVTLTPDTATIQVDQSVALSADVTGTGYAPKSVTFTSSDESIAVVDIYGKVTATGEGTATITATSTFDTTKSATASITVTA